jgi:transposase
MTVKRPLKHCGIDVSKSSLVCAVIADLDDHERHYLPGQASDLGLAEDEPVERRTFSNTWSGVLSMTDWMRSVGVSAAVMESTGIYWCAAYAAIERAGLRAVLANPRQVKNVSVHKTDQRDCVWLAVLLRAGFVRPSYVPTGIIRDLRDATRMRARLMRDLARTKNRCHRVLDMVLVDLGLGDVFGKGARTTLLRALRGGYEGLTEDQRCSFERVSEVQRLMVCDLVSNMEQLEQRVERYDAATARLLEELRVERKDEDVGLLVTVPGMGLTGAAVVKAELGTVDRFESPGRLCSYLGLVPRASQSGPVNRSLGIVRASNSHVRTTMYLVAQKCAQIGPVELREFHERIKRKRGHHVATIALARRLMGVVWRMLRDGVSFRNAYDRGLTERKEARYRRELKRLRRMKREYGTVEFLGMVQRLTRSDAAAPVLLLRRGKGSLGWELHT